MARALALLTSLALASCATSAERAREQHDPDHGQPEALDLCLGDERAPLDDAQLASVRTVWEQLARGVPLEQIPPLPLRAHSSGRCMKTWWTPVQPLAACVEDGDPPWWPLEMRAGTVLVNGATGTVTIADPGDQVWPVDAHVVLRRWPPGSDPEGPGEVDVVTPKGRRRIKHFPEHVIDDDRAIVRADPTQHLTDTRTGRVLVDVRPKRKPTSVAGTVFVPDPTSRTGVRAVGGLDFGPSSWVAFVLDGNGNALASVDGPTSNVAMPVATRDGAIVLAAWRAPELEVVVVRDGKATRRTEKLEGVALMSRDAVVAAGAGGTVVVGLGKNLVILREGAPHVFIDTGDNSATGMRSVAPLTVLDGGRVVVATARGSRDGVVIVDAFTGTELASVSDREGPRVLERGRGVIVLDARAANGDYVVRVDADGTLTRGKIGEAQVGRYPLRTFAGVVDPARACTARLLSKLPPLVRYGDDAVLPDALLK